MNRRRYAQLSGRCPIAMRPVKPVPSPTSSRPGAWCTKVAMALASGSTIVLKPAPETPLDALILAQCVEAALATPVVLWAGWPFFERGWRSFVTWQLNMFSLIGLGVAAAYFFSLVPKLESNYGKDRILLPAVLAEDGEVIAPLLALARDASRTHQPRGAHA